MTARHIFYTSTHMAMRILASTSGRMFMKVGIRVLEMVPEPNKARTRIVPCPTDAANFESAIFRKKFNINPNPNNL